MAFRATLSFAGKEFDVLDCTYSLKRDVDSKGRPSSNIYGGQIRLHVDRPAELIIGSDGNDCHF